MRVSDFKNALCKARSSPPCSRSGLSADWLPAVRPARWKISCKCLFAVKFVCFLCRFAFSSVVFVNVEQKKNESNRGMAEEFVCLLVFKGAPTSRVILRPLAEEFSIRWTMGKFHHGAV